MGETVQQLLDSAAATWPLEPALRTHRNGSWQVTTWRGFRQLARQAAKGLMALGVEPGSAVVIIGHNRPEWHIAQVATVLAGGRAASVAETATADPILAAARHCEAAVAVVQDAAGLATVQSIRRKLPELLGIVQLEGAVTGPSAWTWTELLAQAEAASDADFRDRLAAQQPANIAKLIYAPAAGGSPQATQLSHQNLTRMARSLHQLTAARELCSDDAIVSYLPPSHLAERLVSLYWPMTFGGCSWLAPSMAELEFMLRQARPAVLLGSPALWEALQAGAISQSNRASWLTRRVEAWACRIGVRGSQAEQQGRRKPASWALADRLVLSRVKRRLGLDRCRWPVCFGAPVTHRTLRFFAGWGLSVDEVNGKPEITGPFPARAAP